MNLPIDFIKRTQNILSSEFATFEAALEQDSPVSIRINEQKTDLKLPFNRVPWCDTGYYLPERPNFTFDPLFHAGNYYVQEASSMFLEQAIRQWVHEPNCVLDLCAAPGGKSTHLRALLPHDCLLVSNELIRSRSHILAENLIKWGHPNVVVTQNKAEELGSMTHLFDAIIVDAPCSGEGMFRKDPGSVDEWSVQNVMTCAFRQQNIVSNIWNSLRPGGTLIYSTCTYNLEENERNVQFIIEELGAEVLPIEIPEHWNIQPAKEGNSPVYRFFPHKIEGEGFFLAVLRKSDTESIDTIRPAKNRSKKEVIKIPEVVKGWILESDKYFFEVDQNRINAFPRLFEKEWSIIKEKCNVMHYGISLAEIKGKDLVLNQSLAMSTALNRDKFNTTEIDYKTAISYLKSEALFLDDSLSKGYLLLTHKNAPLGWVKNLDNRANNLYPQEWRIRTSYFPEDLKLFW